VGVVDDEHPRHPVPGVQRGPVEAVVVVPLERGAFGAAVLGQVVDVAFARARRQQQIVAGGLRREVLGDVAVVAERLGGGEAAGLAVELGRVVGAVQVDGEFADLLRQFVAEGDLGALARGAADRRPGEAAAEGPELGLPAREDLLLGELDRDLELGVGEDRRQRQRRAEGDGGLGGRRPLDPVERAPEPTAGEGGEQGAAAEGAEERSAPEAGRVVRGLVRQVTIRPAGRPTAAP
jgi:hypothetical protein